jgi:predicted dehydrogenase
MKAVCDAKQKRLDHMNTALSRHSRRPTDFHALLDDPEIKAIAIATHRAYAS